MVQVKVFLDGGGLHLSDLISSRFIIFSFRNYFTLPKLFYAFEEKLFFSATIILWKKFFFKLFKNAFGKRFRKSKIDFW